MTFSFIHQIGSRPVPTTKQNETELIEGLWVEFELDDDQFEEDKRLEQK